MQGDRLGADLLGLQLLLDRGDFGTEEALGEGAGEQGDEADPDDQDDDGDDLAAGRGRVDVRAEGRELGDVTTLRDPDVMKELEAKIAERGDGEG